MKPKNNFKNPDFDIVIYVSCRSLSMNLRALPTFIYAAFFVGGSLPSQTITNSQEIMVVVYKMQCLSIQRLLEVAVKSTPADPFTQV